MVEVVFFGESLCERAPGVVGCLYDAGGQRWATLLDVIATIQANIPVVIRPATESEMDRAEGVCALYEIGQQIGDKIDQLLDHETAETLDAYKAQLAEQIAGFGPRVPVLDQEREQAIARG